MQKYFLIVLVIFALSIISCSKDEEATTGTITGFVTNYENANQPIAGASLTLNSKGLSKTTGSDGRYEFVNLEPGTYSIAVSANGFQTTTKQVTVYAGQTINCDFQLSKSSVGTDVKVIPENLHFGPSISQLSLTLENNGSSSLQYTLNNVPDFLKVSPSSGIVSAHGSQVVSVMVVSRSSITANKTGQLTVNIGNKAYVITVIVYPYSNETTDIEVSPQNLTFIPGTSSMSFTITNKNSFEQRITNIWGVDTEGWKDNTQYYIVDNLSNSSSAMSKIKLDVYSKNIAAKSSTTCTISLPEERSKYTEEVNGDISMTIGGNTYVVHVKIEKYSSGGNNTGETKVSAGLLAYYTFDNETAEDSRGNYNGYLNGNTFITDSPNGKGKALHLKYGEMITIGTNPLYKQKNYSVNMWIKDYGTGTIIQTNDGIHSYGPTMYITSDNKIQFCSGPSNSNIFTSMPPISLPSSNSWTMITVVVSGKSESSLEGTATIYINGISAGSGTIYFNGSNGDIGTSMTIGGYYIMNYIYNSTKRMPADAMKIDNVRLYSTTLTSSDVKTIYNEEK